jgi:hypothetical protein
MKENCRDKKVVDDIERNTISLWNFDLCRGQGRYHFLKKIL